MYKSIQNRLKNELKEIKKSGLFKDERIISSKQGSSVGLKENEDVLNFCANNYLGLASNAEVIQKSKDSLDSFGFGMASVRFICGTQSIHKKLGLLT